MLVRTPPNSILCYTCRCVSHWWETLTHGQRDPVSARMEDWGLPWHKEQAFLLLDPAWSGGDTVGFTVG